MIFENSFSLVLNKEEFRDAIAMRYSEHRPGLPSKCARGSNFDPVYALDCKKDDFIHSRHDQLGNLEAKMPPEVCQDRDRTTITTFDRREYVPLIT